MRLQVFVSKDGKRYTFDSVDSDRLDRVLVIPIKIKRGPLKTGKKKRQRGVFVLIFGYGETITSPSCLESDLVVAWDENVSFYPLRFYAPDLQPMAESEVSDPKFQNFLKKSWGKLRKYEIHNRPISFQGIDCIKFYISRGGGQWGKFSVDDFNKNLKDKCFKKYPLFMLLKEDFAIPVNDILLWFKNSSFLLLRDVFNKNYEFKNSLRPDPYSVVRIFLKFIGAYPNRRGGAIKRFRLLADDQEAIKERVIQTKNSSPASITSILKNGDTFEREPTKYQIRKFQKIARSSK